MFEQVQPVVGPYVESPAVCRDYDPRAVEVARLATASIVSHLPSLLVEHVGSTSVPGCAGKGIVDLLIVVRDGEELEAVKELLARLGFQRQTGPEPFPETRPMRTGSWAHGGETFLLHVHAIPETSPEVDEMRFLRTCLRADPELRAAYVARKRKIIAGGATDSLDYCRLKGEFLKTVLG
jgi:GrpB-like predicted nucleotidyltransferase (UPF0157 family)